MGREKSAVEKRWKWFGNAGHFILGHQCRFHMTTQVGKYLVSTVGQLLHDSSVREILAKSRGIVLEGRGDEREADWMNKVGFGDIGYNRKFETMVFRAGKRCAAKGCKCGIPSISGSELDADSYNDAGSATKGHMKLCRKYAALHAAGERGSR